MSSLSKSRLQPCGPSLQAGPLTLRLLQAQDAAPLCALASDKRIAATTVSIPHPYNLSHAEAFIQHAQKEYACGGSVIFAILSATNFCLATSSASDSRHSGMVTEHEQTAMSSAACLRRGSEAVGGAQQAQEGRHFEDDSAYRPDMMLVGTISLMRAAGSEEAELGYWIGVPYWGKGYATLAAIAVLRYGFRELSLLRVVGKCFAGNSASAKVLAKAGMRRQHVLVKHLEKWGVWRDEEFWLIKAP